MLCLYVFYCLMSFLNPSFNYHALVLLAKALWDKTLEFRFLLQKPFSGSNRLPQVCLMTIWIFVWIFSEAYKFWNETFVLRSLSDLHFVQQMKTLIKHILIYLYLQRRLWTLSWIFKRYVTLGNCVPLLYDFILPLSFTCYIPYIIFVMLTCMTIYCYSRLWLRRILPLLNL